MFGRARDPSRRRAHPDSGARRPRSAADGRRSHRVSRRYPELRSVGVAALLQVDRHRQRRSRRRHGRCRRDHRRRVPGRRAGAALHRAQRGHRRAGRRRAGRHGIRVDAVPVLRPSGAHRAARLPRRPRTRRADGNRRRLRRQGGISVDDCRPCGARGPEGAPAGQAGLRPRRRHAGDNEASSRRDPASHRRDERRPADGHGHRCPPRRRSLRHAQRRRPVPRCAPCVGTVSLRSRPDPRPRDDDEHAAKRRVPRLRRAADAVRGRGAHGAHGRAARPRPGQASRSERTAPRRHDGDRPDPRRRLQRPRGAARGREAHGLRQATQGAGRHESRHRPLAVLSAPASRAPARSSWRRRRRSRSPMPASGCSSAAPRSARGRGRCSRRSWPIRSACRTTPSK